MCRHSVFFVLLLSNHLPLYSTVYTVYANYVLNFKVPVYEGFAMTHAIQRSDIAGRDVTRYLKLLLRKEGATFKTSAEFECVRQIKERCCQLLPSAYGAYGSALPKEEGVEEHMNYTLPDGTSIDVRFFHVIR